jgi:hypothetical protein
VKIVENLNVDKCMRDFVLFCDNTEKTGLVADVEYQYWVFEQGYLAALSALASLASPTMPTLKIAA